MHTIMDTLKRNIDIINGMIHTLYVRISNGVPSNKMHAIFRVLPAVNPNYTDLQVLCITSANTDLKVII